MTIVNDRFRAPKAQTQATYPLRASLHSAPIISSNMTDSKNPSHVSETLSSPSLYHFQTGKIDSGMYFFYFTREVI